MTLHRFLLAAVLLTLTASVADAYTIVMRDGRRVEIPDKFTITESNLTYEVSSGFQITIQLANIDIAATVWVNGQPAGSFLFKGPSVAPQEPPDRTVRRRSVARRSITNKDLEAYRKTRIQSELAYEKRRKELGLPSAEASRRESAAIVERTRDEWMNMRAADQSAEQYWRGRASSLRSEVSTTQAQLDYVRRRLDEIASANSFRTFSTISPLGSFGLFPNPLFQNLGTPYASPSPFPNFGLNRFRSGKRRFSNTFGGNLWVSPFESNDYAYERAELVNQLNELEMRNAGLSVRWRELEEEARRAGAYPGWLRP